MRYIDFHCDTLRLLAEDHPEEDLLYQNGYAVDLVRMKRAECGAQFFATFMPPAEYLRGLSDETYRRILYDGLMAAVKRHGDMIAFAKSWSDYRANQEKGLMSAFLTFEDGRMVNGSFDQLKRFYDMGYRLITLTWNGANCFGFPNSTDPEMMARGLTDFGKEAIGQMNELGIIVDVSHLSDGGFRDVAEISRKPFIASHSCCRELTNHPRNLTDAMIRAVADSGGIIGVNFALDFVRRDPRERRSTAERICDHVAHMYQVGGVGVIALGSDFDGISGELEVASPIDFEKLYRELSRRGFRDSEIAQFAHGNGERFLRETL